MNDNEVDTNLNYIEIVSELIDLNAMFVSYMQNDQPVGMNEKVLIYIDNYAKVLTSQSYDLFIIVIKL